MDTHKIAHIGEKIVFDLLPGANWVNQERDTAFPYDIKWRGIYIDVKTRTGYGMNIGINKKSFEFTYIYPKLDNLVLVFVGIDFEKNVYFWVRNVKEVKRGFYASTKTSIKKQEVREMIKLKGGEKK
jgi:hypothetical protein